MDSVSLNKKLNKQDNSSLINLLISQNLAKSKIIMLQYVTM